MSQKTLGQCSTGLRDGKKVELHLASSHMKCLLEDWLYEQETVLELVA
jgi:hypothetical protein